MNKLKEYYSKHFLLIHFSAMTLLVITALVWLRVWLSDYTRHGEEKTIPNLVGTDYFKAAEMLKADGLFIMATDSGYNKRAAASSILAQIPAAGQKVKEGRTVYVTVNSLHSPRLPLPDLVDNSSYREAKARLEAMGFKTTEPRLIDGEREWVYSVLADGKSVVGGDLVSIESKITLVIGNGTDDEDEIEIFSDAADDAADDDGEI